MVKLFSSLCKMAAKLIQDSDFLNKHKLSEKAFSRNRKMGFCENIAFILNSLSKTLQIELDDFFQNVLKKSNVQITKQAFSKSRKNIAWEAFWELFALSRNQVCNAPLTVAPSLTINYFIHERQLG